MDPTEENVRNGRYPLWRFLYMYTRGRPAGVVKDFVDWVRSAGGQAVVEQVGCYRIR